MNLQGLFLFILVLSQNFFFFLCTPPTPLCNYHQYKTLSLCVWFLLHFFLWITTQSSIIFQKIQNVPLKGYPLHFYWSKEKQSAETILPDIIHKKCTQNVTHVYIKHNIKKFKQHITYYWPCLYFQILHDLNTFVCTRYFTAVHVSTSKNLAVSASYILSEILEFAKHWVRE